MKLSNLGLRAFFEAARKLNMTEAASELAVTQSALSQRIQSLEEDIGTSLFIRETKGLRLTDAGERLFHYCQINDNLENEILQDLKGGHQELAGPIRIAAFSSVLRSVIIPALSPFLRAHPKIQPEFRSYEVIDLPDVLKSARADMIVLDYEMNKAGVAQDILGKEEYVVVESTKHKRDDEVYLNHGPHDNATESFFRFQGKSPKVLRRSFMGDVYGIIDGVREGLGKAVMSRHLISDYKDIHVISGYKKYHRPVTLHYYERAYYPRLFNQVREVLIKESGRYL